MAPWENLEAEIEEVFEESKRLNETRRPNDAEHARMTETDLPDDWSPR